RHGSTYHYRAFPFNSDGTYGPASDAVTVAVQDATVPTPPTGVSATPLSHGVRIDWERSRSFDVVAYDVYASFYSGGPYQKINAQPVPIPTRTLTSTTFDPTKVYYIVLKSIDSVGNESVFSDEVVVTPLP
ncbi:hypothetical protein L0Y59_00880, partial [Candidatus Uhrbacteria bacterium]|nr:hypothetical protein [Candidatus Uhrbacteria bacterium]